MDTNEVPRNLGEYKTYCEVGDFGILSERDRLIIIFYFRSILFIIHTVFTGCRIIKTEYLNLVAVIYMTGY